MVADRFTKDFQMQISLQNGTGRLFKRMRKLVAFGLLAGICSSTHLAYAQSTESPFDTPLKVDTKALPAGKLVPNSKPQLNCYRFEGFSVSEIVDPNDIGAKSLKITSPDAPCNESAHKGDIVINDDYAGYFMGVKGKFVFFKADDYMNAGLPFVVFDASENDAKTPKRAFSDSVEDGKFQSISVDGSKITIRYRRSFNAGCSLYLDGGNCPAKVKEATGLTALPECGLIYQKAIKEWPQYAADLSKVASIINYEATLVFDGDKVVITPQTDAKPACHMPA
jgi:hypothetical protein